MTHGLRVGREKWGDLDAIDRVDTRSEVSLIRCNTWIWYLGGAVENWMRGNHTVRWAGIFCRAWA